MKNRLLLILPALLLGAMGCKSDYQEGREEGFKAGQSLVIGMMSDGLHRNVIKAKIIKIREETGPEHFPEQTKEYNRGYKEGWHLAIDGFFHVYEEVNRN